MSALRRRPGLRFLVEAVVIVLTAVITGMFHLGPWGIGLAVAFVWLIYVIVEYSLAHPRVDEQPAPADAVAAVPRPEPAFPRTESVRVIPRRPEPEPEPQPEPEPVSDTPAEPEPQPEPEPVSDTTPEPEPEPDPEPVSDTPAEPEPQPEPVPVSDAQPEPEPEPVAADQPAQQWNVWELERALRASGEPNEEREFLLIYLRDYAGPDGLLPLDFDELVRESFPDFVGTPTA